MRSRFAALAVTFGLVISAPVQAQVSQFQFTDAGAGYNAYGVYIGTYGGTWDFQGASPHHVGFNCVDFFHEVTWGQVWDANISSLETGDVSHTRHPLQLEEYQEAAWLISNYTAANVQATQSTLWNLFQNNPGSNWPSDPTLLAEAEAPHPGFDYSDWFVVTDVNANGPNDASSVQEFVVYDQTMHVTSTPEPATFVLMGSGLLGLAGVQYRRRKNKA